MLIRAVLGVRPFAVDLGAHVRVRVHACTHTVMMISHLKPFAVA